MTAHAVASAPERRSPAQIGSFTLLSVVIDAQRRLGTTRIVSVAGAAGSPHSGRGGFAYCTKIDGSNAEIVERATAYLARVQALTHPSIVPVLESGAAGNLAFVIEAAIPGERLIDRLKREPRLPVWNVVTVVSAIGSALSAAHQCGIAHGAISPLTIWIDGSNHALLSGFGLTGRGPERDLEQLAALAFELLSGCPWDATATGSATGGALVERVRGQVGGLSERVATVIAAGLEQTAANQFPTAKAFSEALHESVNLSSQEIAAGAWEAIARQDLPMASILTEMLAAYNPDSTELPLLTLRLNGASVNDPLAAATTAGLPIAAPLVSMPSGELGGAPQNSAGPLFAEAEMRALFGGPQNTAVAPPRGNPWVIFLTVLFGMVALMTVLAAIMLNQA